MFLMSESTTTSTVHPWPHQPGANDTADDDWLLPLQERRSLFGDLRFILRHELWRHRGLLYELMRRDIRVRYKQAVMGLAWAVLMPILDRSRPARWCAWRWRSSAARQLVPRK